MFTHLHVHSEYSLLDGLARLPDLVAQAKALGMEALALTDHGAMYGVIDFYKAATEAGLKPIIGCELYVAPEGMGSRTQADKKPYHLVLLCKNEQGYRNLIQLATKAHLEGFYYKPRVDKELLSRHSQGLIALSACLHGEVPSLLAEGRRSEAAAAARWHQEVFDDFYLELQQHAIPELPAVNRELVALGRELGIPLVATNDVHYVQSSDAYAHDVLLCIQTNTSIYDDKRMRMADDSFYLRSPQEMTALFAELPEAMANTQVIAAACNLKLDFSQLHLPQAELPPDKTADEYLAELCLAGMYRRYGDPSEVVKERLRYELAVIRQTRFADYFLVVLDFISFARKQGILFGVRGSAAASVVLYCLGITDIEPLSYDLVFERFLNPERKEPPDIDLDFADDRRDEVIAYVTRKYGPDRVAQIITFGTLGAKAAIRDVGRALAMTYADVDRVARLVPPALNMTLARALGESTELRQLCEADEAIRHLIDTAQSLEGIARHASTHAAGVVISKEPLTQYVPLQRPAKAGDGGTPMTQFAMDPIADIGLLKMDFLGLGNLTILGRARDLIARRQGVEIDLQQLPLDDEETFALIASGHTTGIFQLESAGMRRLIVQLHPSTFSDLAALVALYRPGPMQHIPTFIAAKHGREQVSFPHPALADILKETYGVIVYQDQVLHIARTFAGYSLGEADVVRKAMGKKIPEVMRQERARFVAGAVAGGFSAELAQQIFDLIEPFAGYAFNKAHSVSYALIAYQTAYLKAHYPGEFMTALLSVHTGQAARIRAAVAECRRLNIPVLPPDINQSELDFTLEAGPAIRFGLGAIKNVGSAAPRPIVEERQRGGPFQSIGDFCRRAPLKGINRRALESLIKAGALDCLGPREGLLAGLDRIVAASQQEQRRREAGQITMFDLWGQEAPLPFPTLELDTVETSVMNRLAWEAELLGAYVSEHPFYRAAKELGATLTAWCGQIDEELAGQSVVTAGVVASLRSSFTRKGQAFINAVLEDLDGSVEVVAWPETYERTKELWQVQRILIVKGKVQVRGDRVNLVCDGARLYEPGVSAGKVLLEEELPASSVEGYRLRLILHEQGDGDVETLSRVLAALEAFPGDDPVSMTLETAEGPVRLRPPRGRVRYCPELHRRLASLLGEQGLSVEARQEAL